MIARIQRIKACLNGARGASEHPAMPLTPTDLGAEAAAVVAAGAEAVHLHPRDSSGAESLMPDDIAATIAAVRGASPGTPVGVSTGLWIVGGDADARLAVVTAWASLDPADRPDFASVNLSEPGAAELADILRSAGIAAEAGVWSVADVRAAAAIGPPDAWARILVEVITASAATAVGEADEILRELDRSGATAPRLLHGEGEACWPLVRRAGELGLPTRIGLEDTVTGPAGERVSGNAELVRLALSAWTAASA